MDLCFRGHEYASVVGYYPRLYYLNIFKNIKYYFLLLLSEIMI